MTDGKSVSIKREREEEENDVDAGATTTTFGDDGGAEEKKITVAKANEVASKKEEKKGEEMEAYSPELLSMYYSRLFPYDMLCSWLSYDDADKNKGSSSLLSRREFSFTVDTGGGEEAYLRYQSFADAKSLEAAVLKTRPKKIDVGAVFSRPPKDKRATAASNFVPVERELVFDVDLTDYDDVRRCGCKEAAVCRVCWTAMTMAIRVVDEALREDLGFEHVAWFFSGRRGVHCWVADERARGLTNEARAAVADYLAVDAERDVSSPPHPLVARALGTLEPLFVAHVLPASGHGLLATEADREELLRTLPPAARSAADKCREAWAGRDDDEADDDDAAERWETLNRLLDVLVNNKKRSRTSSNDALSRDDLVAVRTWRRRTVLKHCWPRLDLNVSKTRNHLLKSPFCVHPKTGRVCVPVDAARCDAFDPFSVPTLARLARELDDAAARAGDADGATTPEWERTSLRESFEFFRESFLKPLRASFGRPVEVEP